MIEFGWGNDVLHVWPQLVERDAIMPDEIDACADAVTSVHADGIRFMWLPQAGGRAQVVGWPQHLCRHTHHDDMVRCTFREARCWA